MQDYDIEEFKSRSGSSVWDRTGFGFGTGVLTTCPPENTSFFCQLSRVFNIVMMIAILAFLAFFLYSILTSKSRFFGGAMRSLKRVGRS